MFDFCQPTLDRRTFLLGSAAGAAALTWRGRAYAATPPHTFKHGAFEISVVSDGFLSLPGSILAPDAPKDELAALLKQTNQDIENVRPATNLTLIRSGSDLVLVDTGSGANFAPTAGKVSENLETAGIDRAKITKIVFTHAHPDHLWGTLDDFNELRFPNASYVVAEAEWNFWTDPDLLKKMPDPLHPFVVGAQKNLARIKDKVTTAKPGQDVIAGVRVLETPGHTPGHMSLEIAGGDGLIVVGDAVPHPVHFVHPEWRFGFDAVPELATASRRKLFDRAASEKTKLIGYHWPFPGIGFAERKDGAYRFVAG